MAEATVRSIPLLRLISVLGIGQIISWGSLYYSLAVLATPIRAELGFSEFMTFGAFTLGLLSSGAVAPWVGRRIDRDGGRQIMAGGALVAAVALLILAAAQGPLSFVLGWILAGLAMAACLYDAAFATLHQAEPQLYRRLVTAVTLFGGFASTVFWPLSNALASHWGWREALVLFALLHLLLCAPAYFALLPRARRHTVGSAPAAAATSFTAPDKRFYWLAASFALSLFIFGALSAFLIAALTSRGFSTDDAVWIAALVGPMQVLGRIAEWTFASRIAASRVGVIAAASMLFAVILLGTMPNGPLVGCVFALCYGAANGLLTIVRGTVPAELFQHAAVGTLLGRLARPAFAAKALAPATFAGLLSLGMSMRTGLAMLAVLAVAALACFVRAIRPLQPETAKQF